MKKQILAIFIGCSDNTLKNTTDFDCQSSIKIDNLKNCKEPNGNYEINLPKNWKKEFFVSENESRLYFADTTKELNQTYIADIGLYYKKTEIDENFLQEKITSIQQDNYLNLISSEKIKFQEKQGYFFHTSQVLENSEKTSLEIYLQNRNKSFFLIKIDVYGNENKTERFCEALTIIEGSNFY